MSSQPQKRTIYIISRIHYAMRSRIDQALREAELTSVQYTVLSLLKWRPNLSSADIARRYFVKPQSMNEIIFGLERRGLIERETSARNRRILLIKLTSEGQKLIDRCEALVDEIEADVLSELEPDTLTALRGSLENVLGRLVADAAQKPLV